MADHEVRIITKMDNTQLDKAADHAEEKIDEVGKKAEETSIAPKWSEEDQKKFDENFDRIMERSKKRAKEAADEMAKIISDAGQKIITHDPDSYQQFDAGKITKAIDQEAANMDNEARKAADHYNQLRVDVEEYAKSLKELQDQGKYFGDEDYDQIYIAWKNATDAVREYTRQLNLQTENGQVAVAEKAAKDAERAARAKKKEEEQQRRLEETAERNLQRETERLEKEALREAKIREQEAAEQRLVDIKRNAVISDQNLVALLQEQEQITERMALLKKAGVTGGYQEYDELASRLTGINEEIHAIRSGFENVETSGRKALYEVGKSAKKSGTILSTLTSRLKGILLSLFVFNWISKGFSAMISAMKEGFQNLAQYSKDYNAQMSALKSSCAQFKNSLAAAFEPIVNMAIPYLVKLINWLIKAADAVAQFMAILQGKSTYTRARKQTIDYAKSLDTASKSAKKALAAFDELNVLNDQGGVTAGGGELTGKDAFEEAKVDPKMVEMLEKAKKLLELIKPLVIAIGIALLAWKIAGLLKDLEGLGPYLVKALGLVMLIAGAALMVYNYIKMWKNGVDWDGIVGYVAGLALAVTGLLILFGPVAAGIGLIVGGAAGLILALKDITENGVNAKNMTLLLISAGAILAGVFLTLGGAATVVVGAVMAVIAAIAGVVVWAGNGVEALATLQDMLGKLGTFVKNVFVGDWKGAFDAIVGYAKDATNMGNIIAESFANGFIKAINAIIDAINSISIDIPDWVPVFGGKKWDGPNIPNWNAHVSLPRLANGAVIQGGQPFLAWLGDQPRGQTNIETPLATMVEAFNQAQRENDGGNYTFVAKLDGREIFRETVRQDRIYQNTHGQSAFI